MGTFVAMPMLMSKSERDLTRLEQELQSLSGVELTRPPARRENAISFELDAITIATAIVPKPIPRSDLEGPCETTLFRKDAPKKVRGDTAPMLTVAFGDEEPP